MNIKIKRDTFRPDGIFGTLTLEDGSVFCVTLEHSYQNIAAWVPKVAPGVYTCLRHSPNRLPYETFELQNVPNFEGNPVSGILIHIGNFWMDSEGCILIGDRISVMSSSSWAIASSKITFEKFMALQSGVDSFQLTIE